MAVEFAHSSKLVSTTDAVTRLMHNSTPDIPFSLPLSSVQCCQLLNKTVAHLTRVRTTQMGSSEHSALHITSSGEWPWVRKGYCFNHLLLPASNMYDSGAPAGKSYIYIYTCVKPWLQGGQPTTHVTTTNLFLWFQNSEWDNTCSTHI
jgi:hypothetical protein